MWDKLKSFVSNLGSSYVGAQKRSLTESPQAKLWGKAMPTVSKVGQSVMDFGDKFSAWKGWGGEPTTYNAGGTQMKFLDTQPLRSWFGGEIKDVGQFTKSLGTKGIRGTAKDIYNLPSQIKNQGFLNTVGSPEASSAFGAMNLLPGIGLVDDASDVAKFGVKHLDDAADVTKIASEGITSLRSASKLGPDWLKKAHGYVKDSSLNKVGEDLFRSSKGVLERMGSSGKEIVKRLENASAYGDQKAGAAVVELRGALKKLSPEELGSFADVVERKIDAVSDVQREAVAVWKKFADDIASEAKRLGVKVKTADGALKDFVARSDYFPVFLDPKKMDKLFEDGKLSRDAIRRYGNLEMERMFLDSGEDLSQAIRNPYVILNYVENAYKRLADYQFFGFDDKELYKLTSKATDPTKARKYIDRILQKEAFDPSGRKVSQVIRGWETVTKLDPLSAVKNLT
jgi:hypothetical protein